ncbi:hypothetical protein ODZ83_07840 [Acaricomes phytoseiuli]|uniref:hypothetical protein n=1 Tax=Acaricomes phytoseiuli TaxID=291968 RepID=UPI002223677A|nr:hypothetical protein [Acaricomes phytoseiuli]MCW1250090.1 hypothetical protein [Acaricomes phytoseiuli]
MPPVAPAESATRGEFRVRYDRLALALAGLAASVTFVVSLIFLVFGTGVLWLPISAVLIGAASVASLRMLALRDAQQRRAQAGEPWIRVAVPVDAPVAAPEGAAAPVSGKSAEVFDSQDGQRNQEAAKPFTAEELRQAALDVAREAEQKAAEAGDAEARTSGDAWEPAEVPKPSYVDAAKAERPMPEPLALPEQPKPTVKTSIKADQASVSRPIMTNPMLRKPVKPGTKRAAQNNLDDVLQRRRA